MEAHAPHSVMQWNASSAILKWSIFILANEEFLRLLDSVKLLNNQQIKLVSMALKNKENEKQTILSEDEKSFLQSLFNIS
ncbi:hypothetical protein [Vibrio owensii]|uniref:hypothetical protein n=1 Tax=Vibrio owensii TaxID=696485 RepID=UPI004069089C